MEPLLGLCQMESFKSIFQQTSLMGGKQHFSWAMVSL